MFNNYFSCANSSFFPSMDSVSNALSGVKRTVLSNMPDVITNNLALSLTVLGDPAMSVPLCTYILNDFMKSILNNDSDSTDLDESNEIMYWSIFAALMITLYPGQLIISHRKNKDTIKKFIEDVSIEDKEYSEKLACIKNISTSSAVVVVSLVSGAGGYIFSERVLPYNNLFNAAYSLGVIGINVLFRGLFFNSEGYYNRISDDVSPASMVSREIISVGLSALYALTSATPFGAAFISESDDKQLFLIMILITIIAYGDYLRMKPGLDNYFGILRSSKININNFEKGVCYTSAIIRTGLTMSSIKDYPLAAKVTVGCLLTPGVGLFQLSSCRPPEHFSHKNPDSSAEIELMEGSDLESGELDVDELVDMGNMFRRDMM